MILKNATNTVEQAKLTAQMASGSSIKVDTLEKSWRTIVNGIEETKRIQDDARRQRVEDKAKLENIKNEFYKKFGVEILLEIIYLILRMSCEISQVIRNILIAKSIPRV